MIRDMIWKSSLMIRNRRISLISSTPLITAGERMEGDGFRRSAIDRRLFRGGLESVFSACYLLLDGSARCPPPATAEIAPAGHVRCTSFCLAFAASVATR